MNSFNVFSKMSTIDSELFSTFHKDHKCKYCGKSFKTASHLKNHKDIVYEGHNDYNCESCGKSIFSILRNKHIHTLHEGHKDYRCESCGKSFS